MRRGTRARVAGARWPARRARGIAHTPRLWRITGARACASLGPADYFGLINLITPYGYAARAGALLITRNSLGPSVARPRRSYRFGRPRPRRNARKIGFRPVKDKAEKSPPLLIQRRVHSGSEPHGNALAEIGNPYWMRALGCNPVLCNGRCCRILLGWRSLID